MANSRRCLVVVAVLLSLLLFGGMVALILFGYSILQTKTVPTTQQDYQESTTEKMVAIGLSTTCNRFALDIFSALPKKRNMLFSPLSLSTSLGMVYLGARGHTAREIMTTLELNFTSPNETDKFQETLGKFHQDLVADSNSSSFLSITNRAWIPADWNISSVYRRLARQYYDAKFRKIIMKVDDKPMNLNDKRNHYAVSKRIGNYFVFRQRFTYGINNIMILDSTSYMNATWSTKFDSVMTINDTFFQEGTLEDKVVMMHSTMHSVNYAYSVDLGCQLLELPYSGDRLSMIFILPRQRDGLHELEDKLTLEALQDSVLSLQKISSIDVKIPKFSLKVNLNLKTALQQRGINDAFKGAWSDFSGISSHFFKISKVEHKMVLKVDEEGTETLRASTSKYPLLHANNSIVNSTNLHFYADHPFIFAVRNRRYGTILYMGRVHKISN